MKKVLKFPHGINHYAFLKCLNDTLHNFMVSVDRDIDESHVPKSKAERKNISCNEVIMIYIDVVLSWFRSAWSNFKQHDLMIIMVNDL